MATDEPCQLIDTCALVNFEAQFGDSDNFWPTIVKEISEGRLKTVRHVWDELKSKFPGIHARLKKHRKPFVVPDGELYSQVAIGEVRIIQQYHASLIDPLGTGNPADPFLIAAAKSMGVCVITDEKTSGRRHKSRIPYVCKARNVKCKSGGDYLAELGF